MPLAEAMMTYTVMASLKHVHRDTAVMRTVFTVCTRGLAVM